VPYASLLPTGRSLEDYEASLVARAVQARDLGFRALKLEVCVNGPYSHNGLNASDDAIVAIVAACRRAVGADVVLMVDSDIVIGQPFDELVESIAATGEFGALIEFGTPFYFENSPTWEQLYEHVGLGEPKKIHQYTGWGLMGQAIEHQFCPPWFNFGVVIAPRDVMLRIGRVFCPLVDRINELEESMYRSQLALSLAVVALNIPYRVLPLRYNFPYEDAVEADNPAEVENAAILHYARQTEQFNKWTDFRDMDRLYAAIRREGQTGILAKICAVLESIYPTLVDEQRGLDDRPFRLGKEWAGLGDPTKQPAAAEVESDDEVLVSAGEDK